MTRLGPYVCRTISAGEFALDGGAMFGIVPRVLWERQIRPDARNRIRLSMRCLLLEGTDRLVLIDNGLGDKEDEKFHALYDVDYSRGDLHGSLAKAGFTPADVTDVILTHLHFDHSGGSTRWDGDRLVPTFPRATYHVQRAHWAWAVHPNEREKASFLARNLEPLEATGQLNLVDGEFEVLPGVSVVPVHGHTEAQQIVKISGGEQTLVYVADLLPTTAHVRPAWVMAYDIRPLVSIDEKRRLLEAAASEGWTLFFEHDAETEIAGVASTGSGYELDGRRPIHEL